MLNSGNREQGMRASALEFRLRMMIMVIVIVLGYWSPWIEAWGVGRRVSLLEWLALEISRTGLLRFTVATPVVIVIGAAIAALGPVLRIWGTAYLGPFTVNNLEMKAGAVMADGPYRYVRNPLYLGSWLMFAAMAFIMPATGAVFAMLLLTMFLLRLILGEERFLAGKLGEPYLAYLRAVPRIFPRLRTNLPSSHRQAQWGRSALSEVNSIGVFITLAAFSWTYNNELMVRAILVSFGVSLVVWALMPQVRCESTVAD
jgi:protein-S-isoprenylcysteine O-methyltransferase Ste14